MSLIAVILWYFCFKKLYIFLLYIYFRMTPRTTYLLSNFLIMLKVSKYLHTYILLFYFKNIVCCVSVITYCTCNSVYVYVFQSSNVGTAAYLSKWYDIKSKGTCKNIQFMMLRSQSPLQFTAGGVFTVNSECLTTVSI